MKKIKKCMSCKGYTLQNKCLKCGENTAVVSPPRFKWKDIKYSKYRRMMKDE